MKVLTRFLLSAADAALFPRTGLPEVAFLGRSNVGKSSLINSLVGSKQAKTSNTPGRTQTINFFEIRRAGQPKPDCVFVDLPGYGYARAPKDVTAGWASFINPYLNDRPELAVSLCLVDANIPPQAIDTRMIDFLRQTGRSFLVVATKSDRVGSKLMSSIKALKQAHGVDKILPYCSKTGQGRDELWRSIREALKNEADAASSIAEEEE